MKKVEVKSLAAELGFDAVGIAPPSPTTYEKYRQWVQQGYHGEMEYLETRKNQREHAGHLLPNVKSIIVLAKNYLTVHPQKPSPDYPFAAVVSRYAWGNDYHQVMARAMRPLCETIHQRTGGAHQARWVVDTAPLLEKDFAAQAGIGWMGKHTNLLSQTLGNWFFLGAVLTTLELEPDDPAVPHCGTCRRCLDACPTNAFLGPFQLDARRCISYLTVELKGPIPRELRSLIGQRVYGCDDCLEVCPWNRHALPSDQPGFFPRRPLHQADLLELMQLDDEAFRQRFKGSPIKRVKRRGLLRNVAVALGNTGDPAAVPVLLRALRDHEPLVRGHSAWALGQIGDAQALKELWNIRRQECDEWVLQEIAHAIEKIPE